MPTLISEMKRYESCWLHNCMPKELPGDRMQWSCRKERQVHNTLKPERKVWGLFHLKVRNLWGNPMLFFHLNRETWSGVLCSETLIHRIWEDLFLKATRITCSIRRDQTWRSKSFMWSLTSKRIDFLHKRTENYNTNLLNLVESKLDCKRNYCDKRKLFEVRRFEVCTNWKRWRERKQQFDEKSNQKIRENHGTIQQLTSQLQQLQKQMNSMNSSGEFQDIESNYSGRLSQVSSQPEMIPSSRSMLSREKRLPLDTWNQTGVQENVFGNQFSTFDSLRDHPQRIQSDNVQRNREAIPHQPKEKASLTSEDGQNYGTIPMPTFESRPLTTSSAVPVELPQIMWSDSKDIKCLNCNSTNSLIHNRF